MSSPVKVAHVVHQLDVGGLERVVINLIKHMPRDRWAPSLYCLRAGGILVEELIADGYPVRHFDKQDGLSISLFPRIARTMRDDGIQIVHCHNYGALLYGAIASRMAKTRGTVYTAHGVYSGVRLAKLRAARMVPVDKILAVSDDARDEMLALGRLRASDVSTLPNGIDTSVFNTNNDAAGLREELGLAQDAPVFGIVARLSPEKMHQTLLEAFAKLLQTIPSARLLIIGDGPIRSELESSAETLGVMGPAVFLGERKDVPRLLKAFDVFVLASRLEGLSLTLLEAAATGLPIVATDVGGNSEVVVDGKTGRIVPSGDAAALADAMAEVAADLRRAREMGRAGRQRIEDYYSLTAMVRQYETVYDELLA